MKDPKGGKKPRPLEMALKYLALKDRTVKEVELHLRKKGSGEEEVAQVIEKLKSWQYLDDNKVALEWARYKVTTAFWGPLRLEAELRKRGVEGEIILDVLRKIEEEFSQEEIVQKALSKYLRTHCTQGSFAPQRILAHLQRKGFWGDIVFNLVQRAAVGKNRMSSKQCFESEGEFTISGVLEDDEGK